jgi:hypothetical protein
MNRTRTLTRGVSALAGLTWLMALAATAAAQTPAAASPDPNPGNMTLTGGFDTVSTYMFRGIRQHSTGIALWPVADLAVAIHSSQGSVKSVG